MNTNSESPDDPGVVIKKTIGTYFVLRGGQVLPCGISSLLRKDFVYSTADPTSMPRRVQSARFNTHEDPVAVGDIVRFRDAGDGNGVITAVLPRRNRMARRSAVPMPGAHPFEQVIAANLDQVVAVFAAARPTPSWHLLDRYLVSAESLNLPSLVVITKFDLVAGGEIEDDLFAAAKAYRKIGYPVLLTSAVDGLGLDELRQTLAGRVSVLVGKSGVGKTCLLNALQPGLGLRVNAVNRSTGKGRHTTTHSEMFLLDFGGAIIDTPGVREFGLWNVDAQVLAEFFPEMQPLIGTCKFGLDCRHAEEPGCAIRQAVTNGAISPYRYQSFVRLREEL
ncbi:MAG: ribosome small subunit-dependent GTPase A [Anaerolineales bacterium]|nr:ribosome small subunit-dependent GTPase A [Anaerolineales bacterium]